MLLFSSFDNENETGTLLSLLVQRTYFVLFLLFITRIQNSLKLLEKMFVCILYS